ncbi:MAG: endonuclease Q family protein [Ignisphaera sp.]|nr:endonuclease Q family protein [Ignisphaera sp.]MCC6055066.1 endonuclease Q family protein [Desulfurococcaceae archaeon]
MAKLKCPKCGYFWDYKGKKQYYATCPNCFRNVSIVKHRIE